MKTLEKYKINKKKFPNSLLLMRRGKNYLAFSGDARQLSELLGSPLGRTGRGKVLQTSLPVQDSKGWVSRLFSDHSQRVVILDPLKC